MDRTYYVTLEKIQVQKFSKDLRRKIHDNTRNMPFWRELRFGMVDLQTAWWMGNDGSTQKCFLKKYHALVMYLHKNVMDGWRWISECVMDLQKQSWCFFTKTWWMSNDVSSQKCDVSPKNFTTIESSEANSHQPNHRKCAISYDIRIQISRGTSRQPSWCRS